MQLCESPFWDANITWFTDQPDFTDCFKDTALVWIPCTFLWLFFPLQLYFIRKSTARDIPFNVLSGIRFVAILITVTTSFLNTARMVLLMNKNVAVKQYSSIFQFGTCILFLCLAAGNMKRGIRSSGILFSYALISLLCSFPRFFSSLKMNILDSGSNYFGRFLNIVYFVSVLFILISYCVADSKPRYSLHFCDKDECPENQSTVISKLTYNWFNSIMWKGYRNELTMEDVWTLAYKNSVEYASDKFQTFHDGHRYNRTEFQEQKQNKSVDRTKGGDIFDNLLTLFQLIRIFHKQFFIMVLFKLFQEFFVFSTPYTLRLLITFVNGNEEHWHGYVYTFLFLFLCIGQNVLNSWTLYLQSVVGLRIKIGLMSLIYKKVLRISNGARNNYTTGEIINLMTVDCQKFENVFKMAIFVLCTPLELTLVFIYLWYIFGASITVALLMIALIVPINGLLTSMLKRFQLLVMKQKDKRLKLINEALTGIKVLKLNAWESYFINEITRIRRIEINILKKHVTTTGVLFFITQCSPMLIAILTFAIYYLSNEQNIPDATKVFVSLSIFDMLRGPLGQIPIITSQLTECLVAIGRINGFLGAEEIDENAILHCKADAPVIVQNGSFSWESKTGSLVLRNINLKIEREKLVAIVGPVGCGKSSLLSAILGELYKISGTVNVMGSVAYVPQQAWILNTTLRDNVCFGEPVSEMFYNTVIDSCALKPDIDILPGGDLTEIGEKGINLSGGQKQRVSIARAICLQADIYLLDDPFSAVDSHVANHIFERVIGPNGMLNKKTRIIVTHNTSFLSKMDLIIVIKDGTITECGSYTELLNNGNDFAEFLVNYAHLNSNEMSKDSEKLKQDKHPLSDIKLNSSDIKKRNSEKVTNDIPLKSMKNDTATNKIIRKEESKAGYVNLDVYKFYKKSIGWCFIALMLLSFIVNHFLVTYVNVWYSYWVSDPNIVAEDGTQNKVTRNYYLETLIVIGMIKVFFSLTSNISMFIGLLKAAEKIHNNLLSTILRWPMRIFEMTPVGRILNRFSYDMYLLEYIICLNFLRSIPNFVLTISSLFVVVWIMPMFSIVLILTAGIFYVLQRFYVATSQQLKRLEAISKSPLFTQFGETVHGTQCIRAYGRQKAFITQCNEKINSNQMCKHLNVVAPQWLAVRLENLANVIVFFTALFSVFKRRALNGGLVGLSMSSVLMISKDISNSMSFFAELENNFVSVERIMEYDQTETERDPYKDTEVPASWPTTGKISFENVTVQYRKELDPVLKGITFTVEDGDKVGIVGRTGAGKSTLVLCLLRIIEEIDGVIVVDGLDILKVPLYVLRSRITIVPQDPVLFSGTVRINLDPYNERDDSEIWSALERTHLKTYISGFSAGLYTELTEEGKNLSVGQRQLICLARALLRKNKIIIMDEATAAIDMETDSLIQETVRTEFKHCTVITIAHRLNTILDYDKIAVLDKGQLMEYDRPSILINSKDTYFYRAAADARLIEQ